MQLVPGPIITTWSATQSERSALPRLIRPLGLLFAGLLLLLSACTASEPGAMEEPPPVEGEQLFTLLPSAYTGVGFANRLTDTQEMNIYTYRNFYNGAGVAVGDLTGNGLPDLFLASNQEENRLYLNEGDYRFRDVTEVAGIAGDGPWATCAVMADVNGNGLLDIYVCQSGDVDGGRRANEFYINQGLNDDGIPVFEEQAAAYGVDDEGYSIHAVFFDYTRDGNLDLYVLNNSFRSVGSFGMRNLRNVRHPDGGDRLYRNDGERFMDVSEEAGIYGSEIAFGLGVAVGDVNNNGWPDIYVSNDFFERDYLYLNNGDGTFSEELEERLPYISHFSMGSDVADINNNGYLDLFITDMLPPDNRRLKLTSSFEGWDTYQRRKRLGYHHQYMRNMLHLNNADGTFSDVGHLAGVSRTDWSWSALFADFDLDGQKDLFVSNGMAHDLTNQDYISYLANEQRMDLMADGRVDDAGNVDYLSLIDLMDAEPIPNHVFQNQGNLQFEDRTADWGLDLPTSSHGAAYADLNGDGALDLIVSNNNAEVSIYRNNARTLTENRFLQIALQGEAPNHFGLGAKAIIEHDGRRYHQEQMPMRGYQSSVDYVLTFGVGAVDTLEQVTVLWPDDRQQVLTDVPTNQRLRVAQADATPAEADNPHRVSPAEVAALLEDVTEDMGLEVAHRENDFVDFHRDQLIPKMLSREGPAVAAADVTGNGLHDLFIGGAKGHAGQLLLQQADGSFVRAATELLQADREAEDVGATFFDATGNGQLDLYVVHGGNEFAPADEALNDRLYLNGGGGSFGRAPDGTLPQRFVSGSVAAAADLTGDGRDELFIGGRLIPFEYGRTPQTAILRRTDDGRFVDVTDTLAPGLAGIGMVTDAAWVDVTGDDRLDLVVVGDWMPIVVFENQGDGTLARADRPELAETHGWWNRIAKADLTGNGHDDLIVGNLGLNSRLTTSPDAPMRMYVDDIDGDGNIEQVLSHYEDGVAYPFKLRLDLAEGLNRIRSQFPTFEEYAEATIADVLSAEERERATVRHADRFDHVVLLNDGAGTFDVRSLPRLAQKAPVYGIHVEDMTQNGHLDLLLAGNFYGLQPEIGRLGSSWGVLLAGDGTGDFSVVPARERGVQLPGETRHLMPFTHALHGPTVMAARNNETALFLTPTGASSSTVAARP